MLLSKLTKQENSFLQLFFDLCPQWRKTIGTQIKSSSLQRENTSSNASVYFNISQKVRPINIVTKVPCEIILGQVTIPEECTVHIIHGCHAISPCTISVLEDTAIGVRLYFNNGIIEELEMYNLAGLQLDLPKSMYKQRTYIVYEENLINNTQDYSNA